MAIDRNKQLATFKAIMDKTSTSPEYDMDLILAKDTKRAIAEFEASAAALPVETRNKMLEKVLDNYPINHYNKEEIKQARGRHHPRGLEGSIKDRTNSIKEKINSLDKEQQAGWLRDNIAEISGTVSQEDYKEISRKFFNLTGEAQRRAGFLDTAAAIAEFTDEMTQFEMEDIMLDPDIGAEPLVQWMIKTKGLGLRKKDWIWRDGILHVLHGEEGEVPCYTLPKNTDARDEFELQTLLAPIARPVIKNKLAEQREKTAQANKLMNSQLFDNITIFPEQMQTPIIVEHALDKAEPSDAASVLRDGISKQVSNILNLMSTAIGSGGALGIKSAQNSEDTIMKVLDMYNLQEKKVLENLNERILDGRK